MESPNNKAMSKDIFERLSADIQPQFIAGMKKPVLRNVFEEIEFHSNSNAKSFDKIQAAIDSEFNDRFNLCSLILAAGRRKAQIERDRIRETLSLLISNSTVSLIGALELSRNGYRLQPGLLLRNSIEISATVLDIFMSHERYTEYIHGLLKSSKSITRAKKVVPLFGKMYGLFSKMYVHINDLHSQDMRIAGYTNPRELPLTMNLFFSHMVLWVLLVVTELTYFHVVQNPRYWVQNEDDTYSYSAIAREQSWINSFFKPIQRAEDELHH